MTSPAAKKAYEEAMSRHRTKLRYAGAGANLYKPKPLPKEIPQWPAETLAKRPDKGNNSRITRAFVHSPKRKVVLHNPYSDTKRGSKAQDHIALTLARLKKSTRLSSRRLRKGHGNQRAARDADILDLSQTHGHLGAAERSKRLHKSMKGTQAISEAYTKNKEKNRQNFSVDPRTMYLLSNYLAFDKIDQHERNDIVNELLGKWLTEDYETENKDSPLLWDSIRSFCESTYILDRITSRRRNPNSLSAAACCDILDIISRKEQRYGRLLRLIRDGIYDSIYMEKEDRGVPFFHRTTWFNHARATESSLRKIRLDLEELRRELNSSAGENIHPVNSLSLRETIERALPQEVAREINAIGPQYTLALMNHLRLLQRSDPKIDGFREPLTPGIDEYASDSSWKTSSMNSDGFLPIREWN